MGGGLTPQGLHALRHTYGSLALSAGVPLEAVAEALGHTGVDFTKRVYADVLLGLKRAAAGRMDAYLASQRPAAAPDAATAPAPPGQGAV